MSKAFNFSQRILALKPGCHFVVLTKADRDLAKRTSTELIRYGKIATQIITRRTILKNGKEAWKVAAI